MLRKRAAIGFANYWGEVLENFTGMLKHHALVSLLL